MARKAISNTTQTSILLKSRRRCCLCFWFKGEDEVKKRQLAHLDRDNENAAEDNLVFLCLEHHDAYDSTPSVSKGLREPEVRKWRDELYKEMEYRFRTVRKHSCKVTLVRLVRTFIGKEYSHNYTAEFRLMNTGDAELRSPVVSFRITDKLKLFGQPEWDPKVRSAPASMKDAHADLFELNGRISAVAPTPMLLRDHSVTFFGLSLSFPSRFQGETHPLEYRVDAEGMTPLTDVIQFRRASDEKELTPLSHLEWDGLLVLDPR